MEDGEAVGSGKGLRDAGYPQLYCASVFRARGTWGWGLSMFDEPEPPNPHITHWGCYCSCLALESSEWGFLPPKRSAETQMCNAAHT